MKVLILSVQGQARTVIAAIGQTVPVDFGLFVKNSDLLCTDPDGSVVLEPGDGSFMLLQALVCGHLGCACRKVDWIAQSRSELDLTAC